MLPGGGGRKHLVAMQLVRRRNIDGVDFLRRDEVREAPPRPSPSPGARIFRGAIGIRAHHGDDFASVGSERADHMLCRNRAGSDQPPTESRHACASILLAFEAPHDARMTKVVGLRTVSGSKSPLASWRIKS